MDKFDTIIKTIYDHTIQKHVQKPKTYYGPIIIIIMFFTFLCSIILVNYFKSPPKKCQKKLEECRIAKDIKYIISDINNDECPELLCDKKDKLYCFEKPGGQRRNICYSNPMEMLVKHIQHQTKFEDICFTSNQISRLYNQITDKHVIDYNINLIQKLSDIPDEINLGFQVTDNDQKTIDKLNKEIVPKEFVQEITLFYKFMNINKDRQIFPDNKIKDTDGYTQLDRFTLLLNTLTDYKKNLLNRAIGT